MAVRVADTIKPLNDGNFPIVDAQDVNMGNGKRLSQMKGAANGYAELDSDGKVPSSQLPSYVDDVIEFDSFSDLPVIGESGTIYITKDNNKTYRWGGTEYVPIGSDLALGTTSSTAFRGDYGQVAYEHATDTNKTSQNVQGLYKMKVSDKGHPYDLQGVVKQDILDLGIDQPSANPTLVGTEDTLTGIEIEGIKYVIKNESTTVIANPVLVGTENELNGLQVGETKYLVPKTDVIPNPTLVGTENELNGIQINNTKFSIPKTEITPNPTLVGGESSLNSLEIDGTKYKIEGGSGGGSQVSTMPTPAAGLVGTIVQYVGATDSNYTNGYFYKCVNNPVSEHYSKTSTNYRDYLEYTNNHGFTVDAFVHNCNGGGWQRYINGTGDGRSYSNAEVHYTLTNGSIISLHPYDKNYYVELDITANHYVWIELEVQSKVPQYSSVIQKLTGDTSVTFDNLDSTKNYKLLAETQDGSLIGIVSCAQSNGTASGTIKLTYTIDKIVASQSPVNFKLEISS